jgi:hypothetical protein
MKFSLLGIQWDMIAITFYIISLIIVTQVLKPLLSKILFFDRLIKNTDYFNLALSWLVGGILYFYVLAKWLHMGIEKESIIQFAFLTALTNGGYKLLKPLILKLKKLKNLEK